MLCKSALHTDVQFNSTGVYFCFSRRKKSPSKMLTDFDDDDDDEFSTDGDSLCEVPSGNNFSKDDDTIN